MANTVTYETIYENVLQDRLDHPTNWKEICSVKLSNTRIISTSYWSTTPAVQSVTRGTGFAFQDFGETAETMTISTERDLGVYVDFGDLAQSPWTTRNEIYNRIAALLDEFIETNLLAQNASWTDFDNSHIGGGAGNITVSAANIDDIARAIKRRVRKANGHKQLQQYGAFVEGRPEDLEFVEAFAQANGFQTADDFLKNGFAEQIKYLDTHWYWNESEQTANHLFAGVRKMHRIGILEAVYGVMHDIKLPAGSTNNNLSGMGYYSRIGLGHLAPNTVVPLLFDVLVATP